jgi:serine/threonine protein kinase
MHSHYVTHLDVSLSNILSNSTGSYAYIDFELSRRFQPGMIPLVRCARGTELPPECERGEDCCPFKVDIWALGVIILRACKASLLSFTQSRLQASTSSS